jgi:copper resistance protein D
VNFMPMTAMAVPPWLVLAHGLHDAAALALLGQLGFRCLIAPVAYRRAALLASLAALLAGCVWFLGEAASVAGARDLGTTLATIPAYLRYFPVAHVLLARLALLAAAGLLVRWPRVAFGVAALGLATQPLLGHPVQAGLVPALADAAHVLAAGLWLGSLPPLLLALRQLPEGEHQRLLRYFSRLGLAMVAVIALTGALLSLMLLGWQRLLTTEYGHVVVVKTTLFALALFLAAQNRYRFTPRLSSTPWARQALVATIAQEAFVGLLVVLAAAWLASLAPG